VLRTHPHMYSWSSAPLEVESEKYVRDTVLLRTLQYDTHEHLSSNDFGSVVPSLRGPPSLPHPPRMLLPCSSALTPDGMVSPDSPEKKKRLRYTPISVQFGETEAASDFGSVCLAEAKSEVHTETHPSWSRFGQNEAGFLSSVRFERLPNIRLGKRWDEGKLSPLMYIIRYYIN
jgi:hypothetical protein